MLFDKRRVAERFGRAAQSYNQAARVQYDAGLVLIQQLSHLTDPFRHSRRRILDLGCGTGQLLPVLANTCSAEEIVAVDLSPQMLAQAQRDRAQSAPLPCDLSFLCADIEALPFELHERFSLLFSNFALQWCNSVGSTLHQLSRSCEPGGLIAMTIPGLQTFAEIKAAWHAVDGAVHVNRFLTQEQWRQALVDAGFEPVWECREVVSEYYSSAQAALQAIKRSGVTNAHQQRSRQLLGKQRYQQFLAAYQAQADRSPEGRRYPVTYDVYSFVARRSM